MKVEVIKNEEQEITYPCLMEATEDQEKELQRKRDELIENQPEHEPNDGCDSGGCVI